LPQISIDEISIFLFFKNFNFGGPASRWWQHISLSLIKAISSLALENIFWKFHQNWWLIIVKFDRARSISRKKGKSIFYTIICTNIRKLKTACQIRFLRGILKTQYKPKKFIKKKIKKKLQQSYDIFLERQSWYLSWQPVRKK